ncbi:zinc transporter ZIP1-like isoform X1 [Anthonomus grandis grandis]|uniref:zinc transporter ZIP1-like isoform X1 n=1 Tax=Anthonomus grandis grandis TaxID=2921223 RepID=UPI0021650217|nr:zinc transporter ZIP1-like isoform X1 [Anthonomus grandis grandis]XP_050315099.1 zinc transporter ZIP1-like isoform X1 [Anthonomus grandis grandis]
MDSQNDLLVAKVVAMLVLGLSSFLLGLLPLRLAKLTTFKCLDGDKNLLLSLLLCFGGGVLLFTTFIHLQPEVRELFASLEEKNVLVPDLPVLKGMPLSELVFCLGFFFVYLVEEAVHLFLDQKVHNEGLHRSLSMRCSSSRKTDNMTIPRVTLTKFDDGNISFISNSNKELLNSQSTIDTERHGGGHSHHVMDDSIKNSFSGFLAVLALSFHAIFEGLAVGLEGSVQKVWYFFGAIATHKLVIAFCVGIELVTSKTKTMLVVLYIGTFAVVTPLGIGIGIILSDLESNQENLYCVVLQGMAAGTLLYVVFFEVLSRERDNRHSGLWQLLAILAGFFVMFALQAIIGHEHSHGEGHHHHHHHDEEHQEHWEVTTQII